MRNVKNLSLCVLMPVLVSTAAVADIHYVKPGESIQAAIVASDPGDEIEVAPGTYTEAIDFIGKAIRLYSSGGPAVTTIDGAGHYHVVQCVNSEGPGTILEGFTITGGKANGTGVDSDGGGMLNDNSSPTVTDCTFTSNTGGYGGGMCNHNSSPTVDQCTFTGNTANDQGGGMYNSGSSPTVTNCTFADNAADYGGGMLNMSGSSPTLTNCNFLNNTADWDGGGMYNYNNSDPTVTNCTFSGNTATIYDGGGMFNYNDSDPTVTDSTFSGNTADSGGGMFNTIGSSPTLTNCTFSGNTADYTGGGMYNYNNSDPTVTNCTFSGNSATIYYGGGMYNAGSSPTVTNCTFSGNTAYLVGGGMCNEHANPAVTSCTFTANNAYDGGGMYNYDSSPTVTNCTFIGNTASYGGGMLNENSSPTVTNCTFSGNTAYGGGDGMYNFDSTPTLANCILWDDSPDEIFDDGTSSTTVTYSDVQGGWAGTGNLNICPLFTDADRRLLDGSPCIDAGNDAAIPPGVTTDLDGNPRIQGVCVDMGAFESEFIIIDFSGWVWMESDINFGYSLDEDDLLYFLSFGPVWYYNTATSLWSEEGPVGWVYVNWPYLYESDTSTTIFALPPESGFWVYHFRTGQWTVSPRIIP